MEKLKKLFALLLAAALCLTVFTGCGNNAAQSAGEAGASSQTAKPAESESTVSDASNSTGGSEEPHKIVMIYPADEQEDQQKVFDAINELTLQELNMTFEPIVVGWGDYNNKVNLMLSGGDELDVLPVYNQLAAGYINAGQLVNLMDYIYDYGQDILDFMGEDVALSASMNGFVYGIPSNKESATKGGIVMRKDIVDELNIDVEAIKTYDDLAGVFAQVKAAHPEMDCISGTDFTSRNENYDQLFDSFGVLLDQDKNSTVVNWYETEEYRTRCLRSQSWYQNGYVKLDAATSTESSTNLVKAGTLFSFLANIKPGYLVQTNSLCGMEMVYAYLGNDDGTESNYLHTHNVNFYNWGIANNSQDKVKAMQFLNFAYTSKAFNDLINWGIEGEHYEKVDGSDVFVDYPEGVNDGNVKYHLNMGWFMPNQYVGSIWNGQPEDIWQEYQDFNDSAQKSVAFGFMYDASSVANELVALNSVKEEYANALATGSVSDVDATLKEFNEKLYAAGLQKVIDTKQEQLDEWLAKQA